MKKYMYPHLVTRATVFTTPVGVEYLFAKNGDPAEIRCHRKQGGYPVVTSLGVIELTDLGSIELPNVGAEVVLVRMSTDPTSNDYTKATSWVLAADWARVAWVVNAQKTYMAVASGHRANGQFLTYTGKETVLAKDTLINIMQGYPRRNGKDQLSSGYKTRACGVTFSQGDVTWYRWETDGSWTETSDPRPVAD